MKCLINEIIGGVKWLVDKTIGRWNNFLAKWLVNKMLDIWNL